MKCRLCLIDKRLSQRSHIIPDFMHKKLYDANHMLYKIFADFSSGSTPTGEYDKDMLCVDCDSKIIGARYDDYAAKVFEQEKFVQIKLGKRIDDALTFDINDIDYTKFKLFLLSILWRASVSKRPAFSSVKLGPYEEDIRKMLYYQDAEGINDFPCILISLRNEVEDSKEIITRIRKHRWNYLTRYSVIIAGFFYLFTVGKNVNLPKELAEVPINKSNKMKILQLPRTKSEEIVKKFMKRMYDKSQ